MARSPEPPRRGRPHRSPRAPSARRAARRSLLLASLVLAMAGASAPASAACAVEPVRILAADPEAAPGPHPERPGAVRPVPGAGSAGAADCWAWVCQTLPWPC